MAPILSFASLSLLLVLGTLLRQKIPVFNRGHIPASVIGGILGLILIQASGSAIPAELIAPWKKLPGFLINIVFAALFLGMAVPPLKTVWKHASSQLAYGQIVAWGQYVVGLGLVLLFVGKLFALPDLFGVLIPVGFEGGHGTAGGLLSTFTELGWSAGGDFALASATAGMLSAVIVGIILVNWAARNGHLYKGDAVQTENVSVPTHASILDGSIESLALHLSILGCAVLIGIGIKQLINLTGSTLLASFPLFPLSMIGGILLQVLVFNKTSKVIVERKKIEGLGGLALDFLVVAAISTLRIEVVAQGIVPFLIIVTGGIAWNVFCVMVLARRLLPDAWFERAIAEMGQSMGVTATGILLLRAADPQTKTPAASAFGYKQLLHEPFMGGGIWTSTAVLLTAQKGGLVVFGIAAGAVIVWLMVGTVLIQSKIKNLKFKI